MIGIYLITNKINNKQYIGQSINIEKRVKEHFWKSTYQPDISYNSILHKAIRKYGKENFDWVILEECGVDCIDDKERYYIKKYNTLYPNGYNILEGGQKIRTEPLFCKECGCQITKDADTHMCHSCYSKTIRKVERPSKEELEKLLRQYNFSRVGRIFGVSDQAIRKWCKNYGMSTKAKDYKELNI